jgi:hypothetical protein
MSPALNEPSNPFTGGTEEQSSSGDKKSPAEDVINTITPVLGSSASIIEGVKRLENEFLNTLRYDQGKSKDPIYTVRENNDGQKELIVPKNYIELLANPEFQILHFLIQQLEYPLILSADIELKKLGPNEDVRVFFLALYNRVRQVPNENNFENLNLSGTSHKERGITYYDLQIIRKYSGVPGVDEYLPRSTKVGEAELINYYLGQLGGSSGSRVFNDLPNLLKKVIGKSIDAHEQFYQRKVQEYRVPYGEAIKSFIQTKKKEVTEKGKKRTIQQPVHIERPDKSLFIMSPKEFEAIKECCTPWDALRALSDTHKKGVLLKDLETVQKIFKENYDAQFKLASSLATWRSRKEEAFKTIFFNLMGKDKKKDKFVLSNKAIRACLEALDDECLSKKQDRDLLKNIFNNLNPGNLNLKTKTKTNSISYTTLYTMLNYETARLDTIKSMESIWSEALSYFTDTIRETAESLIPSYEVALNNVTEREKSAQALKFKAESSRKMETSEVDKDPNIFNVLEPF